VLAVFTKNVAVPIDCMVPPVFAVRNGT